MSMNDLFFDRGSAYYDINVDAIEIKRDAEFMGCWSMSGLFHIMQEEPLDIFYLRRPVKIGRQTANHYIGVYVNYGRVYTVPADHIFNTPIYGVEADNGEVIASRFLDHLAHSSDGSASITGGRSIFYTNRPERLVRIMVDGNKYLLERAGMLSVERLPNRKTGSVLNGSNC